MANKKIELKTATLHDLEPIKSMYCDFFACHAELQPLYYKKSDSGDYPSNIIKSETADIIIASEAGNIVGFVHVSEEKTPPYDSLVQYCYAVCVDLFVLPLHRKNGIGTMLIGAAKDWAKRRGFAYIELNALANNGEAVRLYEKEGFNTVQKVMRFTL